MSRTAKNESDSASDLGRTLDYGLGRRLVMVRGSATQVDMATRIGVHANTYARWERGERDMSGSDIAHLVGMGWNANWLLTGVGPERLEDLMHAAESRAPAASQDLSGEALSIAMELADEKIAADRKAPSRLQYARFVGLIYDALTQGLPEADVIDIKAARRFIQDQGTNDGSSTGVGGQDQG